jgi:hypothetical protein
MKGTSSNDHGSSQNSIADNNDRPTRLLTNKHRDDLRGSGLTDATITAAGPYSITDPETIQRLLGWKYSANKLGSCLAFPYSQAPGYVRLKPDQPRTIKKDCTSRGSDRTILQTTPTPAISGRAGRRHRSHARSSTRPPAIEVVRTTPNFGVSDVEKPSVCRGARRAIPN